MGDVNVKRNGVVRRGGTIDAPPDDIGARAGVRVPVEDLVQLDSIADSYARNERRYDRLARGEISRGCIAVQVEVRSTNSRRRRGNGARAHCGLGTGMDTPGQRALIEQLGPDRAGKKLLQESTPD